MKAWMLLPIIALYTASTVASQALEFGQIDDVLPIAKELTKKYGAKKTVVIFDIDNTLMTTPQEMGTDQWFTWQQNLLKENKEHPDLIAKDFYDLLDNWGLAMSISRSIPVDPDTPEIIAKIKALKDKDGVSPYVFALTSRGYINKFLTIREMRFNGISLEDSAPSADPKLGQPWPAWEAKDLESKYGFTPAEQKSYKLDRKARTVAYSHGVFFTAGLHKGAMMRIIFEKLKMDPKAIVFVDDKAKHTDGVQDAFKGKGKDVRTVRFTHEDARVEKFNKSNKEKFVKEWKELVKSYHTHDKTKVRSQVNKIFR